METFPIVKRKDEAKHAEYRTKLVILEMYDEMQRAMQTGGFMRGPYGISLNSAHTLKDIHVGQAGQLHPRSHLQPPQPE